MFNKCTICYKKVIELLEKEIKSFFLSIYVYYYCQMATTFFKYLVIFPCAFNLHLANGRMNKLA